MKTTSYEISKKLKEMGFKAGYNFFWSLENQLFNSEIHWMNKNEFPAYDLETLLEEISATFDIRRCREFGLIETVVSINPRLYTVQEENESLATLKAIKRSCRQETRIMYLF